MRRTAIEIGALAALLLGVGLAWGQGPFPGPLGGGGISGAPAPSADKGKDQPTKSKLEEMLEKALRDNPDLRLAAAKVAEAEAELNRTRLKVVQKVGIAFQAVEAQRAAVESKAAELQETKTKVQAGHASQQTLRATEQELIDAKAKLAALEAEIPYLLGQQEQASGEMDKWIKDRLLSVRLRSGDGDAAATQRRMYLDMVGRTPTAEEMAAGVLRKPAVQGPTADRIRAALDKPFSYAPDGKGQQRIGDVILALKDAFEKDNRGLVVNINNIDKIGGSDEPLHVFRFDQVPFGAALEWIEDSLPGCRIVIRDYGIVIVPKDQLPPGAPLLRDFWKGAKTGDDSLALSSNPPPAVRFQARVMSVAADGSIIMREYHDNHVEVGDSLEAYRVYRGEAQKDKYLGAVRVTGIQHDGRIPGTNEIIAKPIDKMADPVQPGDYAGLKIRSGDVEKKSPPAKDQSSAPLTRHVEGLVTEINSTGQILVNLGSDHFLAKGNILDVYRPDAKDPKKSKYLGKISIVETSPQRSVAELVGKTAGPVQAGDLISGRIPRD